jgi:hypothetical protein
MENVYHVLVEKMKGRESLGCLDVHARILEFLAKLVLRMKNGLAQDKTSKQTPIYIRTNL